MQICQSIFFGQFVVQMALFANAKQAFPQYNQMEALIASFRDRPIMQTGKTVIRN